jgi:D-3-phosphoglycerate dehydrogenase
MAIKVLCANWYDTDDAVAERRLFPDIDFLIARDREGVPGELPPQGRQVDAIINYSATAQLPEKPGAFPRCRIVVRAGVGFDNLDLAGWGALGVPVCNTPDYGTTEVADHAIALMLALRRGTATYDAATRHNLLTGGNDRAAPLVGRLKGATFGIVGLGRIGLAVARRAAAFDMRVIFYDPYLPNGADLSVGYARAYSLAELLTASDVVSIHTPLTDETRGMIGAAALAAARPGLVLVNTARGPIVDLDALYEALREGRIGGAALDVLPKEPANPDHPLIRAWRAHEAWIAGRFVLTPHAAFYSPAALADLRRKSVEVVVAYLSEDRLTNCVNSAYLMQKP